ENDRTARISLQISRNVKKQRQQNNPNRAKPSTPLKPSNHQNFFPDPRRSAPRPVPFQRLAVSVSGYLRITPPTRNPKTTEK
ncbi:hypothetical protein, partial [Paracoccus shanxieyensis]|uniref:hypothetical protein n=1 Tax=Paracoccus shanxieyensis TaxID=2675752 RepID=UPI001E428E0F